MSVLQSDSTFQSPFLVQYLLIVAYIVSVTLRPLFDLTTVTGFFLLSCWRNSPFISFRIDPTTLTYPNDCYLRQQPRPVGLGIRQQLFNVLLEARRNRQGTSVSRSPIILGLLYRQNVLQYAMVKKLESLFLVPHQEPLFGKFERQPLQAITCHFPYSKILINLSNSSILFFPQIRTPAPSSSHRRPQLSVRHWMPVPERSRSARQACRHLYREVVPDH